MSLTNGPSQIPLRSGLPPGMRGIAIAPDAAVLRAFPFGTCAEAVQQNDAIATATAALTMPGGTNACITESVSQYTAEIQWDPSLAEVAVPLFVSLLRMQIE